MNQINERDIIGYYVNEKDDVIKSLTRQNDFDQLLQDENKLNYKNNEDIHYRDQSGKIKQNEQSQSEQTYSNMLFFSKVKVKDDDIFSQGDQQNNYKINTLSKAFYQIINGKNSEALNQLKNFDQNIQSLILGLISYRQGEMKLAIENLQKIKDNEQEDQKNKHYQFLKFYNLGIIYLNLFDSINAKNCFIQAQLINPSDYFVQNNLAYCYFLQMQYKEARNILLSQTIINKHKDLSFKLLGLNFFNLGQIQMNYKYYSEAVKSFDKALQFNPQDHQLTFLKATSILLLNTTIKKTNQDYTQQQIQGLDECIRLFQFQNTFQMTQQEIGKWQNNLLVCLIYQDHEKNKKLIEGIIRNTQYVRDQPKIINNIGNYFQLIKQERFAIQKYEICQKQNYKLQMLNLGMLELRSSKVGNKAQFYFNQSLILDIKQEYIDTGNVIYSLERILKRFQELEDILPQLINTYKYWLSQPNIIAIQQKQSLEYILLFDLNIDEPLPFQGYRFQQYSTPINNDNNQNAKIFDYTFIDSEKAKLKSGLNLDLNLEIKAITVKQDKIFQNKLQDNDKTYILFDRYEDGQYKKYIYMEENEIINQLLNCDINQLEEYIRIVQEQLIQSELQQTIILDGRSIKMDPQLFNQILALKIRYLRFKQTQVSIKALQSIKDQALQQKELFADYFDSLNFNEIILLCYQLAVMKQNNGLNQEIIFLNEYQKIVSERDSIFKLNVTGYQFNLMIYWLFKRQSQINRDFQESGSLVFALKKNYNPIYLLNKLFDFELDVIIDNILYKQLKKGQECIFCCLNQTILNYNSQEKIEITTDKFNQKIQFCSFLKIYQIKIGQTVVPMEITDKLNQKKQQGSFLKIYQINFSQEVLPLQAVKYSQKAQNQIIKQYLDKVIELRGMTLTFSKQDETNFVVQLEKSQNYYRLIFLEHQIESLRGKDHIYKVIDDLEDFFSKSFQILNASSLRQRIFQCFEFNWHSSQREEMLIQETSYVSQGQDLSSQSFR